MANQGTSGAIVLSVARLWLWKEQGLLRQAPVYLHREESTMKFKVTLWKKNNDKAVSKFVIAPSHMDALKEIGLGKPGDELTVDGHNVTIRYKIGLHGDIRELSRYAY